MILLVNIIFQYYFAKYLTIIDKEFYFS